MMIKYSVSVYWKNGQFCAWTPEYDISGCGRTPMEAINDLNHEVKSELERNKSHEVYITPNTTYNEVEL